MTRPLLALHALFMHGAALAPLATALGRKFIAPGLPGHRRGPPWNPAEDYMAQAARAGCAALPEGEGAVDVFGHSLGATVALHVALERPERVRSLVLFEPAFFAAASEPALSAYREDFRPIDAALAEGREGSAAASFHDIWGSGVAWEALPDTARKTMIRLMPLVPASAPGIVEDIHGLVPRLDRVNCPVLVLSHVQPTEIMVSICEGLCRRLPNAELRCVEGPGAHMLPVTAPEVVAPVVRAFWDSLD